MNTFLPYPDFDKSAQALDNKRLGKQRVEAYQILKALDNPLYGWQHHPAVNMWRGYREALVAYYVAICDEWRKRGYQQIKLPFLSAPEHYELPDWFGDDRVYQSYQATLQRKKPEYYRFEVDTSLPVYWPRRTNETF